MHKQSQLAVVKTMPEQSSEKEAKEWLIGQGDVLDWLLNQMRFRGYVVFQKSTRKWVGVSEKKPILGMGGRPRLIDREEYANKLVEVMGEKEWGLMELCRACADIISSTSMRKIIANNVKSGRLEKGPEGRYRVKRSAP